MTTRMVALAGTAVDLRSRLAGGYRAPAVGESAPTLREVGMSQVVGGIGSGDERDRLRRRILRIHGIGLAILGLANAVLATAGWLGAVGPHTFLAENRLAHAGLIQAYLLAALFGVVLFLGSRQSTPRTWNLVGAGVHLAILSAYAFHWNYFLEIPGGEIIRNAVFIHIAAVAVELFAAAGGRRGSAVAG